MKLQLASISGISALAGVAYPQANYRPGSSGGGSGGSFSFPGAGGFPGGVGGPAGVSSVDDLTETIPGTPGDDYPIYSQVPETSFVCDGQVDGGYYGDPEAECQAFHICASDGTGGLTKYSFLCPNGTLFQQQYFVCDWWFNVDCSTTEDFYSLNDEIAAEREANSPQGALGSYGTGRGGQGGQGGGRRQGAASSNRNTYSAPLDGYVRSQRDLELEDFTHNTLGGYPDFNRPNHIQFEEDGDY